MISNIWVALILTFLLAMAWLRINDFAAHKGWISGPLSRKIIHIGTGPIFVLCWMLFPDQPASRYLASLIPLAITFQFALIGLGIITDQPAVDAMSRSGDRREILYGPLFYGIVFVFLTILYWKNSPIGIIALMLLCGGDGFADIFGKRIRGLNSKKLPWSSSKSWIGSLGMFLGGAVFSILVIWVYLKMGYFSGDISGYVTTILAMTVGATLVESLSFNNIDNLTIPIIAMLIGHILHL